MDQTLSQLPFFAELPPEVQNAMEQRSRRLELDTGAVLIREGEEARSMYFLARGAVNVVRATGETLDRLVAPTLFGEMAIVADTPRLATVISDGPCVVFEINRDDVNALAQFPSIRRTVLAFHRDRLMSNILRANPMFAPITATRRNLMAKSFVSHSVPAGHVFLDEGQTGLGLFVVLRGTCEVIRQGRVVSRLGEGEIFGEISLVLFDQLCTATVRAATDCVVLFLDRDVFQSAMMSNPTVREEVIKLALERLRVNRGETTFRAHLI